MMIEQATATRPCVAGVARQSAGGGCGTRRARALAAESDEDRIALVEQVAEQAWRNKDAARFWMRCPHPALHRRPPGDVAKTRDGAVVVLGLLDDILRHHPAPPLAMGMG